MQITEAIVHGISKKAQSNEAEIRYASNVLTIDERLQNLGESVLSVYGKSVNNYGSFDDNRNTYRFPDFLNEYIGSQSSFMEFAKRTTDLIADRMRESSASTGGYTLFLRYNGQGRDWLMIAMLKLKAATGIDFNTLTLTESSAFDMGHLHEAARIDLEKWQRDDQPYLSFVKRSGRQDEVTRYFRTALGCTEYTDSKKNTAKTLDAMNNFCNAMGFEPERRQQVRQVVYNYCEEKTRNNEPVNIVALSAIIFDQNPMAFVNFIRENNYSINETFSPHRTTYYKLRRISARLGNVSVSFNVEDLFNRRVDYDEENNVLFVTDIPDKLRDEILVAKGYGI